MYELERHLFKKHSLFPNLQITDSTLVTDPQQEKKSRKSLEELIPKLKKNDESITEVNLKNFQLGQDELGKLFDALVGNKHVTKVIYLTIVLVMMVHTN